MLICCDFGVCVFFGVLGVGVLSLAVWVCGLLFSWFGLVCVIANCLGWIDCLVGGEWVFLILDLCLMVDWFWCCFAGFAGDGLPRWLTCARWGLRFAWLLCF